MHQVTVFFIGKPPFLLLFALFFANQFALIAVQTSSPAADAQPATADFFSSFRAVRMVGDRAYVASPAGLLIYDVSERANPRRLSQLFIAPSTSYELEVSGGYAYLLSGEALFENTFLRVIDVNDPLAPRVVAEYTDLVDNQVFDLLIVGMILAVANQNNIDLLDISDPRHPRRTGRFEVVPRTGTFTSLAARNTTVFGAWLGLPRAGQGEGEIIAIDISDPSTPVRIGDLALARAPNSIAVAGETLHVGTGYSVAVMEASDPRHLVQIREIQLPLPPVNPREPPPWRAVVVAKGNRMFAALSRGSRPYIRVEDPFPVDVFDISDPRNPLLLNQPQLRCEVEGMDFDVAQSNVFMPSWDANGSGVSILDLMPDGALSQITSILVPEFLDAEVAFGTTFLVGANTLHAVRPNSSGRAEVLGKVSFSQRAVRLQVAGTRAYVYTNDDGLGTNSQIRIIDIADPANMRVLGSILVLEVPPANWLTTSKRFFVEGSMLYVANPTGLVIYDASDPMQLRLVGSFKPLGHTENVIVRDGMAYIITHRFKKDRRRIDLHVVNVSNPSKPKLRGSLRNIEVADFVTDLAIQDGRLYMLFTGGGDGTLYFTIGGGRLAVVNVNEPSALRLESKIQTRPSSRGYAQEIYVAGELAYVADGPDGVSVISIKRGAPPELLRTIDTPNFANGIWLDDSGNIVVADVSSYQVYTGPPTTSILPSR